MKVAAILFALLVVFCTDSSVQAALIYSGEQTLAQDGAWEGEVLIDGVLTVAAGVTLAIRPGTVVRFTFRDTNGDGIGENEMFIQGRLEAVGSAEAPIRFTSAAVDPTPGAWGAVNLMSEEENVLAHCAVEFGYRGFHAHFARAVIHDSVFRHNMRGLQFQESTVSVERCRFEENLNGLQFRNSSVQLRDSVITGSYWGLRGVYSKVEMRNCRIENNLLNGANLRDSTLNVSGSHISGNRKGLYLQSSKLTMENTQLTDNSEHGLYLENSEGLIKGNRISGNGRAGIRILDFSGEIVGNSLVNNGEYAVQNDGSTAAVAPGNWWGTVDVERISALIRDSRDRPGIGPVNAIAPLSREPAGLPEE